MQISKEIRDKQIDHQFLRYGGGRSCLANTSNKISKMKASIH